MTETTKSLIRHGLTAVGFVLGFVGAAKYTGLLDILSANLDGLWSAVAVVSGVVISVIGFFKDKSRLTSR